jgi:hypothetical protein
MAYWHTDILAYWHTDVEDVQGWRAGHSIVGLGELWRIWRRLWGWGRRIDARSRCGKEKRVSKLSSGARSLVIGARWVGGPIIGVTCPPIAHGVLVVARAWARGKVGWVGVVGQSPAGMMGAPGVGRPVVVDGGCPKIAFG